MITVKQEMNFDDIRKNAWGQVKKMQMLNNTKV